MESRRHRCCCHRKCHDITRGAGLVTHNFRILQILSDSSDFFRFFRFNFLLQTAYNTGGSPLLPANALLGASADKGGGSAWRHRGIGRFGDGITSAFRQRQFSLLIEIELFNLSFYGRPPLGPAPARTPASQAGRTTPRQRWLKSPARFCNSSAFDDSRSDDFW